MPEGNFSNGGPSRRCRVDDVLAACQLFASGPDPIIALHVGGEALAALEREARFSVLTFDVPIRTSRYTPPRWFGFIRRGRDGREYFAEFGVLGGGQ